MTFYSLIIFTLFIYSMIPNADAAGATYYLAPSGSDSAPGNSSTSPWKTFKFAIPKLSPGDLLILLNGTYDGSNSGYPDIRCYMDAKNGTSNQPITIKAENERRAFLKGTGYQSPLLIMKCMYWQFEGLRVESADAANGQSQAEPVRAYESSYLTFRRLLVQKNNRYQNSNLFSLERTNNSLVEECELYSFHRHGLKFSNGDGNISRRNYINSRLHQNISGGYPSGEADRGDAGISVYPGSNNIVENNIVENTSAAVDIEASGLAINNRYLGNIALNNHYGAIFRARGNSLEKMPQNTLLENHVALNSKYLGGYFRGAKNTTCKNCTSLKSGGGGLAADKPSLSGDGSPTFYSINSLLMDNSSYGFLLQSQADFGIEYSNAVHQSVNFSPTISSNYVKVSSSYSDSNLGSCKVFIPDNSPMKRAGKNGEDIGANVLYRYEKGELTNKPLWDPSSGEFTCGAKVAGVNDIAGSSCFDVHKRLNVNTNNCFFPDYYRSNPMEAPPNLRITSMSDK